MAISIDTVYQKVLAFANKEQRGYITPQEFNLFADQAQMEIFEQYFYDVAQWSRQYGRDDNYTDMKSVLKEKIGLFEHTAVVDNITVLNKYGDVNLENDIPNLYRLGAVFVKYPENSRYIEAELINDMKEHRLLGSSKLTKRSTKRPSYVRYHNKYDRIKIFPYPVEDDGTDFDLSTKELISDNAVVTSIVHPEDFAADGQYFYFNESDMVEVLGSQYTSGDIVKVTVTRGSDNAIIKSDVDVMIFTSDSSNSQGGFGHGRLNPYGTSSGGDWVVDDKIFLTTPVYQSDKKNVMADYIRKPAKPSWGYIIVSEKALYNPASTTNFELHPSEESELVYRILAFAGIALEKPNLTQVAVGLETNKVQQEKQ